MGRSASRTAPSSFGLSGLAVRAGVASQIVLEVVVAIDDLVPGLDGYGVKSRGP